MDAQQISPEDWAAEKPITYVGGNMNLQHFLLRHTPPAETEQFFDTDQFPLDDEAIADTAINAMLLIMNNQTRAVASGEHTRVEDYAPLVKYGVRFPWKDRIAFGSCVDLNNDALPDCAVVGLTRTSNSIFARAIGVCEIPKAPPNVRMSMQGAVSIYRTSLLSGCNGLSRSVAPRGSDELETLVQGGYAGVMPDGQVVGADSSGRMDAWCRNLLSYAVSVHNDRRYFWEVTATEAFWDGFPARAMFSIDEEYIKSLFYARSLPMTAKGRMRPILHWVAAHKRRIKEGTDIDVKKHLRGINAFEMHGVNFCITEPRKAAK